VKFTVLMTVYDKEKSQYLNSSLESILVRQTVLPNQFVIVYDGPINDELENVVEYFKSVFPNQFDIVKLPKNIGQGGASRAGFEVCQNELIARMDSDDISMSNRFEQELRIFEKWSDIDVVGGFIAEFSDNPNVIDGVRALPEKHDEIVKLFKKRNPLNNVTVMYKKAALEEIGGYSDLRINEDFNIYVRLLLAGKKFYNVQNTLVKVRTGNNMLERRGDIGIYHAWEKNQMLLLNGKIITRYEYIISCIKCYIFVKSPKAIKQFAYKHLLRKTRGLVNSI